MVEELEAAGLRFVGKDESGRRMEVLELPGHPFFVGVQFHPEFKSRPDTPSALFRGKALLRAWVFLSKPSVLGVVFFLNHNTTSRGLLQALSWHP